MKLQVTRKGHARRDENGKRRYYREGDTFEGTEKELRAFKDRLKRVGGEPEPDQGPAVPGGSVKDVAEAVPDLTDEELDALEQADNRQGVQKAIAEERERRAGE